MDLKARLEKRFCGHGRRTETWQGWEEDYAGPREEDLLLTLVAQRKLRVKSKESLRKQGQKKGRQQEGGRTGNSKSCCSRIKQKTKCGSGLNMNPSVLSSSHQWHY